MEIGSFIEMQFPEGKEYYTGEETARLNSGRAAIWHALRILNCNTIWLPYYQCERVRSFLLKNGVSIKYYHINHCFDPLDIKQKNGEAVLLVNYFGIMSMERMSKLSSYYSNVIIDNAQAFFARPFQNCVNVYSARKFFGVPDGAYVICKWAEQFMDEYEEDFSSDTSLFLLQRIEYGCKGEAYATRMQNEKRIDDSEIKQMSKMTQIILSGTDYEGVIHKRQENYVFANEMFDSINCLNPSMYLSIDCVPMVYPLVSAWTAF